MDPDSSEASGLALSFRPQIPVTSWADSALNSVVADQRGPLHPIVADRLQIGRQLIRRRSVPKYIESEFSFEDDVRKITTPLWPCPFFVTDAPMRAHISSRALLNAENRLWAPTSSRPSHGQAVSLAEQRKYIAIELQDGYSEAHRKIFKTRENAMSANLAPPERKCIEPDNAGQKKHRLRFALSRINEPLEAPIELYRTLLYEYRYISMASQHLSASQTPNTMGAQPRADEPVRRYPRDPFLDSLQHNLLTSLHPDHRQWWPPIDWGLKLPRAHGGYASNTCENEIDEEHRSRSFFTESCDSVVQAIDQRGRQVVEVATQDPGIFALPIRAAYRSPKVLKLCRALFACYALSNFVTLARPSGPIFLGTLVTGTVSTLCSFVQLTTGLDGDRKDLDFIITNKSLPGLSMLFSILFCAIILQGWLKGREKHAFIMLISILTPGVCYRANRPMIQEGHHWLEGIPFFNNICAMFVLCGIEVVRAMRPTPSPGLPGPRGPSSAAVRDGDNYLRRPWADGRGRGTA